MRIEEIDKNLKDETAVSHPDMTVADMREGEISIFRLWCDLYGKIIARDENRPLDEIDASEILEKYPLPAEIDFRMSYVPIKSKES